MKLGCQTFTWEMLGDRWTGGPDDLLHAIGAAGYGGIEITDKMIGPYASNPDDFARALERDGLVLVAYAIGSPGGFTEDEGADLEAVRKASAFAARFGATVSLGSATVMSPGAREAKYDAAARIYNAALRVGAEEGAAVAIHPSSHHDTLIFDRADYEAMFDRLDPALGWVPDTGHILRGGQTVADAMTRWSDRIRYVHLKDVDAAGDWAMLGQGVVDIAEIAHLAKAAPRFNGWLVAEEESEEAARDPAAAVATNRLVLEGALC